MERMGKGKESGTLLGVGTAYLPVKEIKGEFYVKVSDFTRCMDGIRKELEEENETLKDNVEFLHSCLDDRDKSIAIMQEEDKKLNIKVASLEGEIKGLNSVIEKLREENQTLELWLDNKENLNEEYRVKLDKYKKYYDRDKEELMESCYSLAKENEKLKSDLAEDDDLREELDYRKREDKELRKWIKEHVDYQTQADFRKRFEHK